MKVMIVDDHSDLRRVIRQIVSKGSKDQVDFIECATGEDAVIQYEQQKPDYVLMDIEMKKMDGFEATRIIYDSNHDAKVLIVTSHDTTSVRSKAKEVHALGFISKENLSEINFYLKTSTKNSDL